MFQGEADVSRIRCFKEPMFQESNVSRIRCFKNPILQEPNVSRIQFFKNLMLSGLPFCFCRLAKQLTLRSAGLFSFPGFAASDSAAAPAFVRACDTHFHLLKPPRKNMKYFQQ